MIQFVNKILCLVLATLMAMPMGWAAPHSVRIKDIVNFEGVRENQLVGYGLVVGLNGTGDDISSIPYTRESLVSMLERLGVNIRTANLSGKNIAAVMVTANLPAFARQGTRVDITVSAMGTAKDLRGGTLLVTPLLGADGQVYAVGQGTLSVGGFNAESATGSGTKVTKGVPTAAYVSNGAIVEREVGFDLASLKKMHLSLRNPDFTTAKRVSDAINSHMRGADAHAIDPSTISVNLNGVLTSGNPRGGVVEFITKLEQIMVTPDQSAKIVIDDQDGVIVMGEHVRVSTVAVTHGSIVIRITETPQVSQANPFAPAGATTEVVQRTDIAVKEEKGKVAILESGVTLQELVTGLNALGVTPRDLIVILRSIKASGALQADIEVI